MSRVEATKRSKFKNQADNFIEVESLDDLLKVLSTIWPNGRVTKKELFEVFTGVPDRTVIVSSLGLKRRVYSVLELARLFWDRSNYGMEDEA